ncbi:hypothetical protein RB195_004203 [Necator americanus]|uniref:Uncharacterized protein n=1 Tax=Necator americanus TaxID=51031 RepID=A0ABR1BIL7_NECAM
MTTIITLFKNLQNFLDGTKLVSREACENEPRISTDPLIRANVSALSFSSEPKKSELIPVSLLNSRLVNSIRCSISFNKHLLAWNMDFFEEQQTPGWDLRMILILTTVEHCRAHTRSAPILAVIVGVVTMRWDLLCYVRDAFSDWMLCVDYLEENNKSMPFSQDIVWIMCLQFARMDYSGTATSSSQAKYQYLTVSTGLSNGDTRKRDTENDWKFLNVSVVQQLSSDKL